MLLSVSVTVGPVNKANCGMIIAQECYFRSSLLMLISDVVARPVGENHLLNKGK